MSNILLNRRRDMRQISKPDFNSYIQNGLYLQLDCQVDCNENKWVDIKKGWEFVGHDMVMVNGVPFFRNGYGAGYRRAGGIGVRYDSGTIEVCFNYTDTNTNSLAFLVGSRGNDVNDIGAMIDRNIFFNISPTGKRANGKVFNHFSRNSKSTVSLIKDGGLLNYQRENSYTSDYFNSANPGYTDIGAINGNTRAFIGYVYSIRIYNRKLTYEEMLFNQQIDNLRFRLRL